MQIKITVFFYNITTPVSTSIPNMNSSSCGIYRFLEKFNIRKLHVHSQSDSMSETLYLDLPANFDCSNKNWDSQVKKS